MAIKGIIIFLFVNCEFAALAQVPVFELPKPTQFSVVTTDFTPSLRSPVVNPRLDLTNTGTSQQVQYATIMADVENYEKQQRYKKQLIDDANAELDKAVIHYEFQMPSSKAAQPFYDAFTALKKMIDGISPLDLKRAVFLVEHAYDTTLRYANFNKQIGEAVSITALKLKQDKVNLNDNTAKIMGLFQYMSDTVTVYSPVLEKKITSYPKTYDFEDFWGRHDYSKMFVSKTLKSGSGQCHSLPLLFLILCQEVGADANLAFSPNHSFVKFKDKRGNWHNLELTNGMLASDQFMVQSGYIKAEAIQSKIFLEPISKKQTIVQCLNDLALGYIKKFGYDKFVKAVTNTALDNYPNSITAHQINANYYATLSQYIVAQYKQKGYTNEALQKDHQAMSIITSANGATKHIENLGYTDMPQEAYEAWLKSIQQEASRQQHLKELNGLNGMINRK